MIEASADDDADSLLDGAADIDPAWLEGKSRIGVTAGASAPEDLVADLCKRLVGDYGATIVETDNEENNPMFDLNMRLGFRPVPAWTEYRRPFEGAGARDATAPAEAASAPADSAHAAGGV